MKKSILLSLLLMFALNFSIYSQLDYGDLAPDWTYNDVNGNSWNLYSMLDSGKIVFIDYSATWCSPCWNYHNAGTLKNLYNQYGPPGTDEVRVFFFEGETYNTTAQLTGTNNPSNACSSNDPYVYYGGCTKGNWVAGEPYVFVDLPNENFSNAYKTSGFPTIYAICPNRVIREVSSGLNASQLKAAAVCSPAASSANDPALIFYKGNDFTCETVDIKTTLQNYGTSALTACTITASIGGSQVAQLNWTGNLANTYDATEVTVGTTTISADQTLIISVTSADDNASNNTITKLLTHRTPVTPPNVHNFETEMMPHGWNQGLTNDDYAWYDAAAGYQQAIGGYGASNNCIVELFYYISSGQMDDFYTTQYDLTNATSAKLTFDVAYAQYSNENDKLEVEVSTNCNLATPTWSTKYSKAGAALKTADPITSDFIPDDTQWRTDTVDLSSYDGQIISLRFRGTSNYGNNLYIDNIQITSQTTDINSPLNNDLQVELFPNPSSGIVQLYSQNGKNLNVFVYNVLGEIVYQITQNNSKSTIDLSNQPNGIYSVKIVTENSSVMKKITLSR